MRYLLALLLCYSAHGAAAYNVQTPAKIPVNGAIPIGNGTNWDAGALVAGSNVTLTKSGTNITIDATGGGGGGSGTVTSVSVTTANGVSGSVATATTTPAITLTLGAITPSSVAASGALSGTTGTFSTLTSGRIPVVSTSGLLIDDAGLTYNTGTDVVTAGGFSGPLTGNASTATALATGRTLAITGDLAWTSPSFNGSGNVTAAGTLATVNANVGSFGNGSYIPTITVNAKGLITSVSTNAVTAAGTGDVVGPSSSTDNAIVRFDSTTGKLLQNSIVTIDDSGNISGINDFSIANLIVTNAIPVTSGGTGRTTSTTAYGLLAAGTTATGNQQTVAAGATTEILVGGGASALPVWTTAQGSGAPVRATSPTLVTPALGTPSSVDLLNATYNIGNADTTLTRVSAGVVAIEGTNIVTTATNDRYKYAPAGFVVDGGGSAVTTGKVKGFTTVRQAGTITAWNIAVDTGTCTIKVWKVATGTAVPTISNVINTSGVAISSGTYVRSTTTSDFTTTAVAANDILAYDITAVSGATEITFGLQITVQ